MLAHGGDVGGSELIVDLSIGIGAVELYRTSAERGIDDYGGLSGTCGIYVYYAVSGLAAAYCGDLSVIIYSCHRWSVGCPCHGIRIRIDRVDGRFQLRSLAPSQSERCLVQRHACVSNGLFDLYIVEVYIELICRVIVSETDIAYLAFIGSQIYDLSYHITVNYDVFRKRCHAVRIGTCTYIWSVYVLIRVAF